MALAALRGDETAADSLADDATTQAGARGENRLLSLAAYARALLGNGLGRYPAALAAAAEATGRADLGVTGPLLSELVEAAARTGDLPAADGARARLAEWTREAGTPWALGTQATADALAGPHAEAEARYVEAVARFTESRLDLPLARAELLLGEWLRRENRRADARRHLRTAHEMFSTMGADGFRARAARELAATGETVRKREVGRPTELTPQEAQIARLAVQGSTNPEIGAALYLSPRTVEWHLRKVFAKFGITSRRELAGALRPH
jgi:DNA-binding CsgD family transcriptional regulator